MVLRKRRAFGDLGVRIPFHVLLEVVCNLGAAGASTPGKDEGVTVTLPDGTKFEPQDVGITVFTHNEEGD